jgi:hypothetical protein
MAELSKHVPIIPVIMKADTMTIHEAQRFRQEVVNRLQNPGGAVVCVGRAVLLMWRSSSHLVEPTCKIETRPAIVGCSVLLLV